jgi:hypothetical protein
MFELQRLSRNLRAVRLEDGPPYGPGNVVWSCIGRYPTEDGAQAGMRRLFSPAFGPRLDPARYRIAHVVSR